MAKTWYFPMKGFVKVNVHARHYNSPLQNENTSGIGIVLRNDTGEIIKMVSGTIRNITNRASELWAMFTGLRTSYYEKKNKLQLESDNAEAVKEWLEWMWNIDENHGGFIERLKQRQKDPNLELEIKVIEPSQNLLAYYLARDGAMNRNRLVVFRRSFGRVKEYWRRDMGLGLFDPRFNEIEEEDFLALQNQMVEVNMEVANEDSDDERLWLMEGAEFPNMGGEA